MVGLRSGGRNVGWRNVGGAYVGRRKLAPPFTLQTRIIYKLFEVSSQFMKYLFVKSFDGKNFKMMSGYA